MQREMLQAEGVSTFSAVKVVEFTQEVPSCAGVMQLCSRAQADNVMIFVATEGFMSGLGFYVEGHVPDVSWRGQGGMDGQAWSRNRGANRKSI